MNTTKTLFRTAAAVAVFVFLLFSGIFPLYSRGVREPSFSPGDPIPRDPKTIVGTLENGMRYYIRRNTRPENRAELRLVVNAGSVLEDEDQRGLAHFVEHMAFNGTRSFAKQELVGWLESIGMRFGPETNAYTSFDETVYQLEVPTDKKETVETALLILEDWAQGLSMDPAEIERERGVILEEWRLGRGAAARVRDVQFPTLLSGSLYAERLPIGKPEVITGAPREALVRYYRDWYRPDLMALVAVGDFDPDEMEGMVRERFSRLVMPPSPRPRPLPPVPDHPETLVSSATDPELGRTSVGIYAKRDAVPPRTIADYRLRMAEGLFFSMMNARLDELSQMPDAPFLYAAVGASGLSRPKRMYYASAVAEETDVREALSSLVRELKRVAVHGFTPTELDRAGAEYLSRSGQTYREMENLPSGSFVSRFVDNYLEGSPMPGPEYSHILASMYVPEIRPGEVSRFADILLEEASRVVLIGGPGTAGDLIPSDSEVLAALREAAAEDVAAYADDAPDGALLAAVPAPGSLKRVDGEAARAAGAVEWRLGNGARVVLKTTGFKNDEVLMTAFSPGGSSLAADGDFLSADFAENVAEQSGTGPFSRVQLEKFLSGKQVSLSANITELSETLRGSSSVRDLETFFELIHSAFAGPRYDEQAVDAYLRQVRASLRSQENRPESLYFNTIREILTGGHPRGRPLGAEMIDDVDPRRAFEFYRERFDGAGDFTFVFVGSVTPEELEPFLAVYLASLPGGRTEPWRDTGIRLPRGRIRKVVKAGLEQKSLTAMYFTGPFEWSYDEVFRLRVLEDYLDLRLREVLREDQGGTYGVSVSANPARYPAGEYSLEISFGAAPDRVDALVETALAEIGKMKESLPDEKDAAKLREQGLRVHERWLRENAYWLEVLRSVYFHGLPGDLAERRPELIRGITPSLIRDVLVKYIDAENLVRVTLFPAASE